MNALQRFVLALFGPQSRLSYRRLTVFVVGTVLLCYDKIDATTWLWVAGIYLASEVTGKVLERTATP
jgi:hypothetical protein